MRPELSPLYAQFREIRTMCTGVMGYLAMLSAGDFKNNQEPVVRDLAKATGSLAARLDDLRDHAAALPRITDPIVNSVPAAILASEPRMRLSIQALSKRLASVVTPVAESQWTEELRLAQRVVREVAVINDAFRAASSSKGGETAA